MLERLKQLTETVRYVRENSPFYKEHYSGVDVSDFTLDKFRELPFTTKDDIAENNNSFCCVPESELSEYVTTSGTLGEPITIFLTKNDLKRLAQNEAQSLSKMGCSEADIFQLLTTLDKQFMAGIAYYSGVLELGARIVRTGPGIIPLQWKAIAQYKPTVLIAVPRFIAAMLDFADQNGIDYQSTTVKQIICIGEPLHNNDFSPNDTARSITDRWNVELKSTYASTEMATAFYQCGSNKGCHNNDELLYTEVVDEDGNQVKNGEQGEIVITTLKVEGTPLVRYKTGDIATFWSDECGCGESSVRLGPIVGRKSQLIKYKGTSIYPQSIFNSLNKIKGLRTYFIEVKQNDVSAEEVRINLAIEEIGEISIDALQQIIQGYLRVSPVIELKPKKTIENLIFTQDKRKPNYIQFTTL